MMKAESISRRRVIIFRLICIALPILLLLVLEGALRLCGWGGYANFFRELPLEDGTTLVVSDLAGSSNYFYANRDKPGTNDEFSMIMPKPDGTIRVFLCGASAIKGFPQPRATTTAAFLEQMLQDAWHDKQVEVLNFGTTAVASFPVLDIVRQAAEYDPDLIILYTGNNEFFGAYGVASVNQGMASPTLLAGQYKLRSTAVMQAMQAWFGKSADLKGRTLMEAMIDDIHIEPNSEMRTGAARLLHAHVSQIATLCKSKDIPLMICLPAANERGLAPLGEYIFDESQASQQKSIRKKLSTASRQLAESPEESRALLNEVVEQCPEHARAAYLLAECEFTLGNHSEALAHYRQALDLDPMPWRPPATSVNAIKQAAEENGVTLCDVSHHFREVGSPAGIGWELMDDHVHFSIKGQYELARALVLTLQSYEPPLRVEAEQANELSSQGALSERLGHTIYDDYCVAAQMRTIFDIPFMRRTNPTAFRRWSKAVDDIESEMSPQVLQVAKKWHSKETHAGAIRPLTGMVARVMMREQRFDEAAKLFRSAQWNVPEYSAWHMEYVYFSLICSEELRSTGKLAPDDQLLASKELERGRVLLSHGNSVSGMVERHMGRIHQLLGEYGEAIPYLQKARERLGGIELVANDKALFVSYMKTGEVEAARSLAEEGIKESGKFRPHYQQMMDAIPGS